MKFVVPEFEDDKKNWELQRFKDGPRGLFCHKAEAGPELLVASVGNPPSQSLHIGTMDYYKYRSDGHIRAHGKVLKIFGVRIEKWWGLEDEDYAMRVVWSGKQWEYCKPEVVKVTYSVERKGEGASAWANLVRIVVSESNHPIFSVIIERDGKDKEGKVRLR